MPPAVSVKNLSKSVGRRTVLAGVSFDIEEGEMLVLLGPSGAGKTTVLRIIAGLDEPDAGEVYLNGRSANRLPASERGLGVVFQEYSLFPKMTVGQNVGYGLRVRRRTRREVEERVARLLALVRLEGSARKYPSQLSGGERQRVALARALAYEPDALLLDEPFGALDPLTRASLRREVRALLRSMNVASLFITHDQEEAFEMGDRVAILNRGRLEQTGTPFEIYNEPTNEFVASFIGAANVLLGRWREGHVWVGALRLKAPAEIPELRERQAVKIVFRPEDVAVNFQPQLLDAAHYLGRAVVEDISYVGPSERMVVRLILWPTRAPAHGRAAEKRLLTLAEDAPAEDFPLTITRTKWEAGEMELSAGDSVVVGLKDYRLLPHYPLSAETGAQLYES